MEREPTVVILGAGYVGLTLGLFIASHHVPVLIVDVDAGKVDRLQRGDSTIYEADIQESLSTALSSGYLRFSCQSPACGAPYWIVAVPYLPSELCRDGVGYYRRCLQSIRGAGSSPPVVMVRSTVPVGFTRSEILPALGDILGAVLDEGFFLTACPERTLTGKAIHELASLPQLVGGSPASLAKVLPFLESCGFSCIPLEGFEAAELGKAICNLSRLTQFNLANFFGLCCERFGIQGNDLLRTLMTHYPRLQLPMPGTGVGGSCLPKDSLVLFDGLAGEEGVWSFPREQYLANEKIIAHVTQAVIDFARLNTSRPILALGIAFKGIPPTDDTRNSVGLRIVQSLMHSSMDVRVCDLRVQASSVTSLGLQPATLPIHLDAYSAILLLNNDPGYLELLHSVLAPRTPGTIGLYDPWRLLLSDSPTVFARALPLDHLYELLQRHLQLQDLDMSLKG